MSVRINIPVVQGQIPELHRISSTLEASLGELEQAVQHFMDRNAGDAAAEFVPRENKLHQLHGEQQASAQGAGKTLDYIVSEYINADRRSAAGFAGV